MQKLALTRSEWRQLDVAITAYTSSPQEDEVLEAIRHKANLAGLDQSPSIVGRHGWIIDDDSTSQNTIGCDPDVISFRPRIVNLDALRLRAAAKQIVPVEGASMRVPRALLDEVDAICVHARSVSQRHLGAQRVFWVGVLLGLPEPGADLVEWVADGAEQMSAFTSVSLARPDPYRQAGRVLSVEYDAIQYSARFPRIVLSALTRIEDELREQFVWPRNRRRFGVMASIALSRALPSSPFEVDAFLNDLISVVEDESEMHLDHLKL